MYGAQTSYNSLAMSVLFENDVEMYGAQTFQTRIYNKLGLRMM